jgi:hypothetical protein
LDEPTISSIFLSHRVSFLYFDPKTVDKFLIKSEEGKFLDFRASTLFIKSDLV